ncbi:MAG: hypothetical protein BJ554DRAFT_2461 [Olpidium bornovanus]|uniref:Uncharacterized protein n=1 Tax=Olpidium bornovanus TaxID=278681 RepID=A0A8H7ZQF0_9FUNG|nr:MAG: hypothetical protein BJ554DRAFT_2461 [Olpidium bornovanus]
MEFGSPLCLSGGVITHCGAAWAGCRETRSSTTGFMPTCDGGVISWRSAKAKMHHCLLVLRRIHRLAAAQNGPVPRPISQLLPTGSPLISEAGCAPRKRREGRKWLVRWDAAVVVQRDAAGAAVVDSRKHCSW